MEFLKKVEIWKADSHHFIFMLALLLVLYPAGGFNMSFVLFYLMFVLFYLMFVLFYLMFVLFYLMFVLFYLMFVLLQFLVLGGLTTLISLLHLCKYCVRTVMWRGNVALNLNFNDTKNYSHYHAKNFRGVVVVVIVW
jgi:hypothetical protein